ncbi:MAG: winged helix-turn-helix domain-containing protein [Pseudomonadota bacterium]
MDKADSTQVYETGGFRVDPAQRVLFAVDGTRIALPSRAFELLLFFVRHPGELLDKNQLMAAVWPNTVVEENNLNQCIGALRKALVESPGENRFLVTESGRGYRFVASVRALAAEPANPARVAKVADGLGRRWGLPIALIVALLAAVFLFWWPRGQVPADRSIAVLPFENRSQARADDYLALGIQDEILTLLTRIADLRVLSRTATARYAHGAIDMPAVSRSLGVSYLLGGSVQRAGDTVRVNVTLIDAVADRQLWAQTYERSAVDVFAIESEVAQSVARALEARLTAQERSAITRPPTANPAAYEYYLRARAFAERTTRTEYEIRAAIDAYEEAVRLDPGFAIAWAQLSRRHANFFSLAYDRSESRRVAAQRALAEATRLAPDLIETLTARAYYLFVVEGDYSAAESAMLELEARAPQSADAASGLAQLTHELGQMDRSADYARRVLALDPLNPYRQSLVCLDYLTARKLDLAAKTCDRALELLPGDAGILTIDATIYQARGELDRARALLQSLTPAPGDWRTLRALSRQYQLDRKPTAAVALLGKYLEHADALGTRRGVVRRWLADAQRLAGDAKGAHASYATARAELEAELAHQEANPVLTGELAIVRARLGDHQAAVTLADRCLQLAAHPRRESLIADCTRAKVDLAQAAGDTAGAIRLLRELAAMRGLLPPLTGALVLVDPEFDNLRGREFIL